MACISIQAFFTLNKIYKGTIEFGSKWVSIFSAAATSCELVRKQSNSCLTHNQLLKIYINQTNVVNKGMY